MSIPKIIHQTWKTTQLPENFKKWSDTIKQMHPEWEWKLWTDEDNREFIRQNYNWFLPVYDSYDVNIKRVDAVRYFLLYHFGGVYLDMDVITLKPLDELLLHDGPVFGYQLRNWDDPGSIANAIMLSPSKHPFFTALITGLKETSHLEVLQATGPSYLTSKLREHFNLDYLNKKIYIGSSEGADFKTITLDDVGELHCAPHNLQRTEWNDIFTVERNTVHEAIVRRKSGQPWGQDLELTSSRKGVVRIYPMPYLYTHEWNQETGKRCTNDMTIEECQEMFPESYTTTFWTATWQS